MRSRKPVVLVLTFLLVSAFLVSTASAVPGFARKYDISCNQCHNPWPNLNAFGRNFKENGYRLDAGSTAPDHLQKIDEKSWMEKLSFVSAKINGRLYDEKKSDPEFRLRTFHEVELFLAGHASNNLSFLVVAEAEDETTPAFNLFIDWGAAGWHPRKEANFVAGYGPIFFVDPYNTLSDGSRRLTRSHKAPLDVAFDGAAFTLRKSTQFLSFYGRSKDFYYSATMGTGNDDAEGKDDKDFALRLAYDFPVISAGAFYIDGTIRDGISAGVDENWTRTGIDFQVEKGPFSVYGMWVEAEDEITGAPVTEVSNNAAYIEALYVFERNGQPLLYPLLRWETFEASNGADSTDAIAVVVGGFLRPNINMNLEYWKETSVPGGGVEDDRLTLFFNIGL